jgi:hypothetical protein
MTENTPSPLGNVISIDDERKRAFRHRARMSDSAECGADRKRHTRPIFTGSKRTDLRECVIDAVKRERRGTKPPNVSSPEYAFRIAILRGEESMHKDSLICNSMGNPTIQFGRERL